MATKKNSRQRSIKSKLMAAISMLLVSTIMLVSSTYAWFTLSTAPEVTGITTAVGANGNLEMALMPKEGGAASITSTAGDGAVDKAISDKNITWGNLVELADTTVYGLDKIKLLPAALNLDASGKLPLNGTYLQTPVYGADGRVSELAANTFTGIFNEGKFMPDNYNGVRAVGTASGMTQRQLDYRNSASDAASNMNLAKGELAASLTANGAGLANVAIKHGLGQDAEGYKGSDLVFIKNSIDSLQEVVGYIEDAYLSYILTYAASSATGAEDGVWNAVKLLVEADGATLAGVTAELENAGLTLPTAMSDLFNKVTALKTAVSTAAGQMPELTAEGTYAWDDFKNALTPLMDSSKMTVNGYTIAQIKENTQLLVDAYMAAGEVVLTMAPGSGVYADIADQCGNYSAKIKVDVKYGTMDLKGVPATMKTAASGTPDLETFGSAAKAGNPTSADASNPISDFYGFVIDLAFRTNAANSNLMLEVDGKDRIYSDNTNEATMGHGSTMTFKAGDATFTNEQMLKLMDAIRVIFFDPTDGEIIKRAKLDTAVNNVTYDAEGAITAKLSLCTEIGDITYNYTQANDGTYKKVVSENYTPITTADGEVAEKFKWDEATSTYVADAAGTYKKVVSESYAEIGADETVAEADRYTRTPVASETAQLLTDKTITSLDQGVATPISVLVYLDGNKMTNADVATGELSMTGSMNLQFASDVTLVPMEYAALHQPAGGNTPNAPAQNGGDTNGDDAAQNP